MVNVTHKIVLHLLFVQWSCEAARAASTFSTLRTAGFPSYRKAVRQPFGKRIKVIFVSTSRTVRFFSYVSM